MVGLYNPSYLGDSVLLEPIARKLSESIDDEVSVISHYPDLYIGHPSIKGFAFSDPNMPASVTLIDMTTSIRGMKDIKDGKAIPAFNKYEMMCQTCNIIFREISQPTLYLTAEEKNESERQKKVLGGQSIGIVLESRHTNKNWEYMPILIKSLLQKYHVFVIGEDIRSRYPYLRELRVNYLEGLSIRQLMIRLSVLDLVVGVDTGPMHVASALKVPTVVIGYDAYRDLYSLYEQCTYIGHKNLNSISVRKVFTTCNNKLKITKNINTNRIGILLLEGLGGTVTLSDHAKKVYDYSGRKPYLIIRKYRELFENNPYVEDCVEIGMIKFDNALQSARIDFDTVAGIKTGVGKWYQKGKKIFRQDFSEFKDIYKNHPLGSRELEKYGLNMIQTVNKSLGLPYDTIECSVHKYQPLKITLPNNYIIVNNGVDTWHKGLKQTKSWEHAEWERLVKMLNYPVIQTGTEFDERIDGAIDLRQSTTIQQLLTLLKNAQAIICTEGGLMHLGNAVGNKNVFVMRGPTAGHLFSYPTQINIDSTVCSTCYWDIGEWYRECPKGLDNLCMKSITAERVYAIIKGELGETLAKRKDTTCLQLDYGIFRDAEKFVQVDASI